MYEFNAHNEQCTVFLFFLYASDFCISIYVFQLYIVLVIGLSLVVYKRWVRFKIVKNTFLTRHKKYNVNLDRKIVKS
jgi:uncharacterized membrane protein YciS (DUF1049 family)